MSPLWILLTLLPVLGGAERFNCKSRILGAYYADAKSGCKAFHVCVRVAGGGIRDFRFFCPPGTLFHQEAQTCTDWGDDDPLACPADIYDGFDNKKLSSQGNRDDEAEFGLQRAETGDRRLSQNNANRPDSDLRAAHSSDFFSGQRDRGRDELANSAPSSTPAPSQNPYQRQSFRRATTPRSFPTTQRSFPTTQYSSPTPYPTTQPPNPPQQYDVGSKRKLVRKRPIYVSTKAPPTTLPNISPEQNYPEPFKQQQQNKQNYQEPITQQKQQNYQEPFKQQPFKQQQQQQYQKQQQHYQQQQQQLQNQEQHQQQEQQQQSQQNNFNRRVPAQNKQAYTAAPSVPPQYKQYKDEYVEVPRVTPKQSNRFYPSLAPSTSFPQPPSTATPRFNKKDSLVELYNYDAQSTPGLSTQKDNRPFNVKNSFSVEDVPRDPEFARVKNFNNFNKVEKNREFPTTTDYSFSAKTFPTTTPAYKNFNSVSYEPEKNNFVPYSKQNQFNNPTTTFAPSTTIYTTSRPEPPPNLNTVAYNTNIAFNTQAANFADNDEDDGQYHPPQGEDDGLYRPEIYERELLSGAHSLNIAASGNRLPEDRKTYAKTQHPPKHTGQTAAPRPFRPAPTQTVPPTTRAPETTYPTTSQPQTVNPQRTFDYFQTYTTTSRPNSYQAEQNFGNDAPARPTTTLAPRAPETRPPRPPSRAPQPPAPPTSAAPAPPPASRTSPTPPATRKTTATTTRTTTRIQDSQNTII
ncbi:unnamed protein product [Chrysodeixis includens]|uniref:Chitin-binding type-2 domain-containing protein n=1 Tax=Chrysodeixis includens TaxID=689277 RepID=A0A9P0C139_CHRIL|nr:unnamed protein product [Chrysodeixis includens]